MSSLEQLEPQRVFHYFEEMNQIPRGTFDSERISNFLVAFAKEHELEYVQDEVNNVIIKKPGSAGYENSDPVIIQGHMDMVCEKTEDSTHDFTKDPIEMYVEDGFVKAKDTTLGGDDGIAVAYALAILESEDLEHPPLEVIITVDEEVGMVGANHIDLSGLKGRKFINIDSDVEGTILSGCAGGFTQVIKVPVERAEAEGIVVTIHVRGLQGGHSGIEIDQQRGNANKIMGRLLLSLQKEVGYVLMDINGGNKDNVITPNAIANVVVSQEQLEVLERHIDEYEKTLKTELYPDEPNFAIVKEVKGKALVQALTKESTKKIVFFVTCTPNGVQGFSRELEGLVETSLNLGVIKTSDDAVQGNFLIRSSFESKKQELKDSLGAWVDFLGAAGEILNEYPGWAYKSDSELRPLAVETYINYFGHDPIITTVHAGLECGLLSGQVPELDCISIGPNMHDIHSVNERLDIASTQRYWNYLLALLKACK